MKTNILVTGAAGYIGSHVTFLLNREGYAVIGLDNLSKGHASAFRGEKLLVGDLLDRKFLQAVFAEYDFAAVLHFAALSLVGESMTAPERYFRNNIVGGLNLIETMIENSSPPFIFSSTAAVYGNPECTPITEKHVEKPINPYGESKYMLEKMLQWCGQAHGLRYHALRYFNAAGAWPQANLGEDHNPETHLIPALLNTALKKDGRAKIFGTDYPTPDGTCVRDYIHVMDLAQAHVLSLKALLNGAESDVFNLGNGTGFSVLEVLSAVRTVTSRPIPADTVARRPGDPPVLIASSEKIREKLGWKPTFTRIEEIVQHAWDWSREHPDGFPD